MKIMDSTFLNQNRKQSKQDAPVSTKPGLLVGGWVGGGGGVLECTATQYRHLSFFYASPLGKALASSKIIFKSNYALHHLSASQRSTEQKSVMLLSVITSTVSKAEIANQSSSLENPRITLVARPFRHEFPL